ncbi:hypothetical protein ABZT23_30330 [Streptomyces sp. NPDC005386]|uniref:hypothetical protein n=1 Tax=Streptomyces sp. NPDC005386 TaxID=3154562 RepID=UPI0033A913C6
MFGLLTPARVNTVAGYRSYAPDHLDQARLVAWLVCLGLPLARTQQHCVLDSGSAGQVVRAGSRPGLKGALRDSRSLCQPSCRTLAS